MSVKTVLGIVLFLCGCGKLNCFGEELPRISDFLSQSQASKYYGGLLPIYEIGDRYYWQIADTLYGRDF